MGLRGSFRPRFVLILLLWGALAISPVEAEWSSLSRSPGAGAYPSVNWEPFRFDESLNYGFGENHSNTLWGVGRLSAESSDESDTDGCWLLPLFASTRQFSFSDSFTVRGNNFECMVPFRPFFGGVAVQKLEVTNNSTGRSYHPTIFRAGVGVGTKRPNRFLIAGGAYLSSMNLLDRQFTAIAIKSNVTWVLPGGDAVLLSVVSPAAAFSESGNEYGFHDLRLGIRYFHELYGGGPDLVLDAYYYGNRAVEGLYGRGFSAGLVSRNGLWRLGYELAYTPRVGATHTFLADVLVCFDFQDLLKGRNPLELPPAPFARGRNLERAPMIEGTLCGLLAAALSEMILRFDP